MTGIGSPPGPRRNPNAPFGWALALVLSCLMWGALAAVLFLLAGCGSTPSAPRTLPALMTAAGCRAGTVGDASGMLFTADGKQCGTPAGTITVYTFGSAKQLGSWVEVAKLLGGGLVVGDRWAVVADSTEVAQVVQHKLGGKVED